MCPGGGIQHAATCRLCVVLQLDSTLAMFFGTSTTCLLRTWRTCPSLPVAEQAAAAQSMPPPTTAPSAARLPPLWPPQKLCCAARLRIKRCRLCPSAALCRQLWHLHPGSHKPVEDSAAATLAAAATRLQSIPSACCGWVLFGVERGLAARRAGCGCRSRACLAVGPQAAAA